MNSVRPIVALYMARRQHGGDTKSTAMFSFSSNITPAGGFSRVVDQMVVAAWLEINPGWVNRRAIVGIAWG
ncbi:hypothetical protein TorRG33x02_106440 [Trema orientale]|uniref:Uncharacterized protein n=1 Tax=Trema orientale TaxID=63057 RepID=A0A2P5F782_TREOI|nr:hypothetical protein TorRG33x02_106440 [Trema orientale]